MAEVAVLENKGDKAEIKRLKDRVAELERKLKQKEGSSLFSEISQDVRTVKLLKTAAETSDTMQEAMVRIMWLLRGWVDYVEMTAEQYDHKHGKRESQIDSLIEDSKKMLERFKEMKKKAGWKGAEI